VFGQYPRNLIREAKASFHIAVRFNSSYPTVKRPNIFHACYIGRKLASDDGAPASTRHFQVVARIGE
jgi:hypothetical protein